MAPLPAPQRAGGWTPPAMGDSFLAKGARSAVGTVVSAPRLTCALWPLLSGSGRTGGMWVTWFWLLSPYP